MKTNRNKLVMQSVQGRVHHPVMKGDGYRVGYDGMGRIPMATGGITYNYQIGDSCMGIIGDHVEPSISMKNPVNEENCALMAFACIGNPAKIISGDAKGKTGFVTGKHGGIDHVMVYFPHEVLSEMCVDDTILIKAYGQGLKLKDHPDIFLMNIDPDLFDQLGIKEKDDILQVPIVTRIPAFLMGSGLGCSTMMNGDYDIMSQDKQANETYGIDQLRFGDFVLIEDHDNQNGPHYLKGAVSIGVIVHSDSYTSGHGPGVTIIMSSKTGKIEGLPCKDANLAKFLVQ
ncbi:MAG: DUF4438 domain-containing protein [Erysipelotrichaceae bacterium]